MKHKCLRKGIITLCLMLCFSVTSPVLFAAPLTAYAAEAEIKLNVKSKTIVKGKQYALKVYNLTENQTVSLPSFPEKDGYDATQAVWCIVELKLERDYSYSVLTGKLNILKNCFLNRGLRYQRVWGGTNYENV